MVLPKDAERVFRKIQYVENSQVENFQIFKLQYLQKSYSQKLQARWAFRIKMGK